MSRSLSWCLLVVWSAWLFAIQGAFATRHDLAVWTPDLGIALLLALDHRLERSDALLAVLIVSGSRIAFTSDPQIAVLVGYAALVVSARRLRRGLEIDRLLPRAVFAALAAIVLNGYWSVTRTIALAADGFPIAQQSFQLGRAGRAAASTAIAAALIGPLLMRLPGMSPLRRRRR